MKRTLLIASLVGTFALGWALGDRGTPTVDAAPKAKPATCKDDLAKTKVELTAANETIARLEQDIKDQLAAEQRRVKLLEERLSAGKTTTSKPVQPKKLDPIQKLD